MRKYSEEYLEILKNNSTEIENNGVKIILKPSPGEDRKGYLDPCEKAIMDEHWATRLNDSNDNSVEKKSDFENMFGEGEVPSLDIIIQTIRYGMGFPNLNLNTVEIYTKYETIKDSGNNVGLWSYYPRNIEKEKNKSALVFFHGGAWIGGSIYAVENFCKLIAEKANCVVFNVDYSLAPEKPFPNGVNDNYCAVKHIYENADKYGIDEHKIAVAGDSAGGNYAAVVSLKARDEGIPMVALQVLIYPGIAIADVSVKGYEWSQDVFEVAPEQEKQIRSMLMLGKPVKISSDKVIRSYLREDKDMYNPYVSPIMAKSHADLPKAILVSAEFDGLRIQTEFYAKQLQDAGVDVTCYRYKGVGHAFIDKLGFVPQAEDLANIIAEAIKNL